MKTRSLIGIAVAVVGILSFLIFIGTNQDNQLNQETQKTPIHVSPQIQKQPTKSEVKVEPVKMTPKPVTEPVTEPSIVCSGVAKCFAGKVTKITDGDTINVNDKSIRFALISAPEFGTSGGIEAKNFIEKICPVGSKVIVDEDDGQTGGSFGRIIAEIYCDGISLNEFILEAKLATIYTEFCSKSEFASKPWAQYGCSKNIESKPQNTQETTVQTSSPDNCDPSYPDFCIPSSPPDLDCKDISQKGFKVKAPDPHHFDGNKNGIGCE